LEITEKRRVFTNKELNYTCIELFESDGIYDYFHIDHNLFKYDNKYLINNDIFILQYPYGNELSFSFGKILSIVNNDIKYNAATEIGSSGSPIIRRCKDNYVIGIHIGYVLIHSRRKKYNIGTTLFSILENIKEQINDKIK
jgi:V8-like Glu-specific endopeptidase